MKHRHQVVDLGVQIEADQLGRGRLLALEFAVVKAHLVGKNLVAVAGSLVGRKALIARSVVRVPEGLVVSDLQAVVVGFVVGFCSSNYTVYFLYKKSHLVESVN